MLFLKNVGVNLVIIPRNPPRKVFHKEGVLLLREAIWLPLINSKILFNFIIALISRPKVWELFVNIIKKSRSINIILKNMAVFPKAIYLANILKRKNVDHIHAHWGSTTSTMALVISEMTDIPWSMTLHRWDIKENNLLELKAEKAKFIRCISENGKQEVLGIVGKELENKVKVLHLGVSIPNLQGNGCYFVHNDFIIACPANIIPVKGHRYLIEACALIKKRGIENFKCLIIGDGYLEKELKAKVKEFLLENHIIFMGRLPNEKIIEMYSNYQVDVVVLPSIVTKDGEKEGIPVSLMEAMAHRIPVISTNTGSIPELLGNGAGVLVSPESSQEIADSICKLMQDENFRREIASAGYKKIEESFNNIENIKELISMFESSRKKND